MDPYDAYARANQAPTTEEHAGISHAEADRRARSLVKAAAGSGDWRHLAAHLHILAGVMAGELEAT